MADDEADFGLVKSFNIDDGQLDGLTPQHCFVLGYELADIYWMLRTGNAFTKTVHSANADRISEACKGRECRLQWFATDRSETWMTLEVKQKRGGDAAH